MGAVRLYSRMLVFGVGRQVEADLKQQIFDHLLRQEPGWVQTTGSGEVISRATSDVENVRRLLGFGLPELPDEKKARFISQYGLSPYDASVLVAERDNAAYFEDVAKGRDGKTAANWVINELFGRLNKDGKSIESTPVSAAQLGGIIDLIGSNVISGKIAKDLFEIVFTEGGDPAEIVEKRGMKQVTDTGAIEKVVDEIIAANPEKVEQAKAKPTLLGWFVGQVMKSSGGKANPGAVNDLLKAKLGIE